MTKISNQYSLTNVLTADVVNGRVGINNGSPTVDLDVTGAGKFSSSLTATSYNATTQNIFAVDGTERMRITSAGRVGINVSPDGIFHVKGTSGAQIIVDLVGNSENYYDANTHVWRSGSYTERMRITSGGSVAIGTTTTGYKLHVEATSANYAMLIKQAGGDASFQPLTIWHAATSGNRRFIDFAINAEGNNVGSINFNSSTGLTMYNTSSDYRLKSDIQDFNALDIIKNLKPKKYKMLNANNKSIGFIAHELQEFFPQAVSGEKDEERMQQVDYSQLTGLLTKAIQELSADLTSAKQEIELLKAK
jgi:hypothetical protein